MLSLMKALSVRLLIIFFTCMGGIYSQRAVTDDLAPPLVQRCLDEEIDVVLLVPV